MRSEARVTTAEGERYAGLLCKHAAHMTPRVEWTPPTGTIEFPDGMGTCSLIAEPGELLLAVESENSESLAKMQRIIADNIARFAFREGVKVEWSPTELH